MANLPAATKIPDGWRLLANGERIAPGDQILLFTDRTQTTLGWTAIRPDLDKYPLYNPRYCDPVIRPIEATHDQ